MILKHPLSQGSSRKVHQRMYLLTVWEMTFVLNDTRDPGKKRLDFDCMTYSYHIIEVKCQSSYYSATIRVKNNKKLIQPSLPNLYIHLAEHGCNKLVLSPTSLETKNNDYNQIKLDYSVTYKPLH